MKIIRLLLISCLLVLAGCSSSATTQTAKEPFVIEATPIASFSAQGGFTKIGVVSSAEQVTVSSQVAGRVTSIAKKVGAKVGIDQLILAMKDTAGNITFNTKRAAVGLNASEDSIRQQQLALDKALFDSNIALQRNQITSQTAKEDIARQQEKLAKDRADNNLNNSGSNLSLQLNKLNVDLAKAQLDYQTKLDSDNQTILNFINSVKLIGSDLGTIFNDAVETADNLLGVSQAKEQNNDAFEPQLGNKDFYAKAKADEALRKAFVAYEKFKSLNTDINANTMSGVLAAYQQGVSSVTTLLLEVENLLNATQPGGGLTDAIYASYKSQVDVLQAKASGVGTSITSQLNNISSFFATFKQSQESLAKGIDSLKAQLELSKRQVQDAEFNAQLGADRQELSLDSTLQNTNLSDIAAQYASDFATKNNAIALDVLQNSLAQAQVAYDEAVFASSKFNVIAPIQGTITDILVDNGQEVVPGTPLFTIVNTNLLQVELDVTAGEKELVVPGQTVVVNQGGIVGKGIVEAVSDVADSNFGYKITVVVTEGKFDIGSSIQVQFAGSLGENIIVPLNAVNVVDNGRGVVQLWKGGKIVPTVVGLGSMAGEYVIITDGLEIDNLIITSDVSNFDPVKMEARVKAN